MLRETLIDAYCRIWSDPDAGQRARRLSTVWSPVATYTDPTVEALDGPALLQHIERMQQGRPGATVRRCTGVDGHHRCARFGFEVVGAGGAILRAGIDIVFLTADGRQIERVVGFFGPLRVPLGAHRRHG